MNRLTTRSDPDASDRRWIVLALLCTAQLLVILDATIVNIALPSIQRDLDLSDSNLQWSSTPTC